jgi:hypothetical protein
MRLSKRLRNLLLPLADRLAASVTVTDPWERFSVDLDPSVFGDGSLHDFSWYFEGTLAVNIPSVQEMCDWLYDCEYQSDPELFQEPDFWQHPRTFEHLRKGDCEDHALWSWRKLAELGFKAELVIGTFRRETYVDRGHVWVVFESDGESFLLEGTSSERDRILRRLSDARDDYIPHAGVDTEFRTWGYMGAAHTAKLRRASRRDRKGDAGAA